MNNSSPREPSEATPAEAASPQEPDITSLVAQATAADSTEQQAAVEYQAPVGDAALQPLIDALAVAETWGEVVDLGVTLAGLKLSDPALLLPALRHESRSVRDRVALVFEDMGAEALPYAPHLAPLLADPDEDVRGRAVMALKAMGPKVLPQLRAVRRSSGPFRREALTALADIGGWDALDPIDQAAVRRLINVKIRHETPEPMYLCGSWYALPTRDQSAVLKAFGLSDATPVTMRLGHFMWHHDHHMFHADPGGRVYVSPAFDGWTLVFGEPSEDAPGLDGAATADECLAVLSRQFGAAHWYYEFEGLTGWGIAEQGEIIRRYDAEGPDDEPVEVGPPHPAEQGFLLPHQHNQEGDTCWAADIAARASVDPSSLGPDTVVEGHAVLALTAQGRR
ncbi:MAG: HEAT repeat domain-containing protein, partial [Micromonosporaceae bacterium]